MKIKHKTPCNECPWRRASVPGFMGGHDPADYAALARHQVPTACHKTVQPGKEDKASLCAGMSQHLNNSCSRPRDLDYAAEIEAVGTNPDVFSWVAEFEAHHAQSVEEWMKAKLKAKTDG